MMNSLVLPVYRNEQSLPDLLEALDEIEAVPLWQDGDTDEIQTEAGTREFRVAPPATLNDYQRSLVG